MFAGPVQITATVDASYMGNKVSTEIQIFVLPLLEFPCKRPIQVRTSKEIFYLSILFPNSSFSFLKQTSSEISNFNSNLFSAERRKLIFTRVDRYYYLVFLALFPNVPT